MPTTRMHWPLLVLLSLLAQTALCSPSTASQSPSAEDVAATFPLQTRPFLSEPSPEQYFAREGQPGPVLNCSVAEQFRDRTRYELEWTKIVGETPILVSRNGRLFGPVGQDGYELADTLARDGGYHLRLRGVQFARDNGRFFCALIDTETRQQVLSEPATVVVLVPPQPPLISAQPSEPVREGEFVSFRCESSGGNPAPRFQWLFGNRSRVPDGWFHERSEPKRTVSTLQWHLSREENRAYLTCQIWNRALKEGDQLSVETERLNVLFAPRVQIKPGGRDLNVEEGDLLPLECRAEANPPPASFQWMHSPSGEVHLDREWRVPVRRAHTGEFRCTATNTLDSGSGRVRVNVLYGPTVRIGGGGTVSPAEGERLVLDCEAEASPRADAVAWTGPNGFQRNGSRLVIESINRAQSGNFTCTAWNTLPLTVVEPGKLGSAQNKIRTGTARVFVDVRRRPGPALVIAKRTTVATGDQLVLGCSTDGDAGSPPARFRWSGPQMRGEWGKEADWNKAQLRIPEAQLSHNGVYRCQAYNEIGQGEAASVRLTVVEPARILRPLMPSRTLSPGASGVSLECEARGFPQPTLRWLKDGLQLPVDAFSHWTVEQRPTSGDCPPDETCLQSVLSSLLFSNQVRWSDKGNYSCQADNSPAVPPAASSTSISVIHEPVLLNKRFTADGMALAAAELGSNARLVCRISAKPEPTVTWSRNGEEIAVGRNEGGYRKHKTKVPDAIDEYEAVLELDQVRDADYTTFTCEARNSAGTKKALEIRLQPRGRPQMPQQTRILGAGTSWLLVGWSPGFDGGEPQQFELEWRDVDAHTGKASVGTEHTLFVFGPHNWTQHTLFGADGDREFSAQPDTYLVHNLTRLRPQSSHWYRVRARNLLGESDWTPIASGDTADARESVDIQAPEQALYLVDEQRLVVQPLKYSASHCLLVYVASEEDGNWRSLGCFPLSDSDGSVRGIAPAERFKVRYCMTGDLSKCSTGLKIFVEQLASAHSLWMIVFIFCCICFLTLCILVALLCCRRRFQQKVNAASAGGRPPNGVLKPARKKLNLNGGVVVDRIEIGSPLAQGHAKNTPVNGSQTDSGVFTLGSSSAVAANAIAANKARNVDAQSGNALIGAAMASSGEWNGTLQRRNNINSGGGVEPYDFSTDPFLQEFAAANALGGIVVVDNALHQSSSTESTPNLQQQNPYSKFFNEFSAAFLGSGGPSAGGAATHPARHSMLIAKGGGGRAEEPSGGGGTVQAGNSNEQLLATSSAESTGSSDSASYNNGNGGRVMREIIV